MVETWCTVCTQVTSAKAVAGFCPGSCCSIGSLVVPSGIKFKSFTHTMRISSRRFSRELPKGSKSPRVQASSTCLWVHTLPSTKLHGQATCETLVLSVIIRGCEVLHGYNFGFPLPSIDKHPNSGKSSHVRAISWPKCPTSWYASAREGSLVNIVRASSPVMVYLGLQ